MKGVYKETAPKEYMFNGVRNWAWGELHTCPTPPGCPVRPGCLTSLGPCADGGCADDEPWRPGRLAFSRVNET